MRTGLARVRATSPNLAQVCLVHGEEDAQAALSDRLRSDGYVVTCPKAGETVTF
ncbi:MAG TPA: hypothetical protein VK636_22950 [Gemmatimonadaceae bacterium]|nr:hypothetical protein [Gemmatimonadaceae bacterium]